MSMTDCMHSISNGMERFAKNKKRECDEFGRIPSFVYCKCILLWIDQMCIIDAIQSVL